MLTCLQVKTIDSPTALMALSTDNGTVFNPILDTALPWMQSLEKTKKAKLSNAMTNSLILCYDSSEITTKFI